MTAGLSDLLDRFRDFQRDTTAPMPTDLYLGLWNAVGRLADLEQPSTTKTEQEADYDHKYTK